MKNITNLTDFIVGCMGVLFSLYVYYIIIPATISIPDRELTFYQRPDALPTAVILIILVISLIITIGSFSKKNATTDQKPLEIAKIIREVALPVSIVVACCMVFLIFLPRIGYIPVSIVFLASLFLIYGLKNILMLLTLSITVSIGLFYFFERALRIFLP